MLLNTEQTPFAVIERKIAERNVITVEINAVAELSRSKNITGVEKLLPKKYYDFLRQNELIIDKEIYKVFYELVPENATGKDDLLERIEVEGVQLWTYMADLKVLPNPLIIDAEAYKSLSPREKTERKIAEHNILEACLAYITRRRKSKKMTEFEAELLRGRQKEITEQLLACFKEIWKLGWFVDKETDQKIKAINTTKTRYDALFKSLKFLR